MNPAQLARNMKILEKYVPEQAVGLISKWIYDFDFKLKIKRTRSSKFGDYRPPLPGKNHQITVNNDLNRYAFLLTLVHEIAHLSNFIKTGDKVAPHGREWKHEFRVLMQPFFAMQVFPPDVRAAVEKYLNNPAATSCSDIGLQKTLKNYDEKDDHILLETLTQGSMFEYKGMRFSKGAKRRKRYICLQLHNERSYLFSPVAEVLPLPDIQ